MFPFHLPDSSGYLVALSGGADSRLLLELTVRAVLACRAAGETVVVEAAHLHHGIRGQEADRDEAFCRAVCESLGVHLTVGHADIPAMAAAAGESEETTARRARYAFLADTLRERGIPVLLTAHNADDGLETLLHHLLRGSGTRGMGGIPPTRTLEGGAILVRPLLSRTRREILDGCRELGLDYVTDSTNLTDDATRNRLRHHVTPALEAIAGRDIPQRAATRLSAAAREDDEALMSWAAARFHAIERPDDGIPCALLRDEPPAVAKRILLLAYEAAVDVTPDRTLSAYHTESLLALARTADEGAVSDTLPAGRAGTCLRATVRGGRLRFERLPDADKRSAAESLPACPLREGTTVFCPATETTPAITLLVERADAPLPPRDGPGVWASAVFPADALPLPLCVRPREAGDHIRTHGMSKKLKKLLCDKHIPSTLRDRLPLVCLPDGTPLWYPGVAFCDGYLPPRAGRALRITVYLDPADLC